MRYGGVGVVGVVGDFGPSPGVTDGFETTSFSTAELRDLTDLTFVVDDLTDLTVPVLAASARVVRKRRVSTAVQDSAEVDAIVANIGAVLNRLPSEQLLLLVR